MKKYILLIISIFFIGVMNVEATPQTGKLTCVYKSLNSSVNYYLDLKFNTPYVGANVEKITLYTGKSLNDANAEMKYDKEYTEAEEDLVNFSTQLFDEENWQYITYTPYGYISKYREEKLETNPESLCPESIFVSESSGNYQFYACGNDISDDATSTCSATQKYVNKLDGTIIKMNYVTSNGIAVDDMFNGKESSNAQDQYNKAQKDVEKYCDEELDTYDKEQCEIAQKNAGISVDHGSDIGKTEEELEAGYVKFKNNLEFGDLSTCNSYLGYIHDPDDPAYYLNFAFQFLKYAAIIILLVFTVIDFAKAIATSKDDAIKKAAQNTIKRLIIAVIIFFLPDLINFVFDLLGIVSTDATCGIGTNV